MLLNFLIDYINEKFNQEIIIERKYILIFKTNNNMAFLFLNKDNFKI